ncbi:MAG: hypothetical protein ACTSO2_19990 [Promethearchaeota archaeon]
MPLNPISFYKRIEEDWHQGDVVRDVNISGHKVDLAVLITPQCDIIYNKTDFFLFSLTSDFKYSFLKIIDPNNRLLQDHIKGLIELSRGRLSDIISNIIHHFHGAYANRFYYLPPDNINNSFGPNYLDFQRILTIPEEILTSWKEKRVVTIADPFRSQILSRYISYIGRIGTPEYTQEEIYRLLNLSGLSFRQEDFEEICRKKLRGPP